ncbi:MAG: hypothetical protein JNK05_07615 [Myxococcales bacterium]|nr:hypothetical protein [Myxococcales bacterium]
MAHNVRFDALPAGVREAIHRSVRGERRRQLDGPNPLIDYNPAEDAIFGPAMVAGILGAVATLALWLYAGGPFAAAVYFPTALTIVSLCFFAPIALFAVSMYRSSREVVDEGTYLFAGTVFEVRGDSATVHELAPATTASYEVKPFERVEYFYKNGTRYRRTVVDNTKAVIVRAITTDGAQFTFKRDAAKLDGARAAQLTNERFARWRNARAINDHHTMAALDPFAQCYAQRCLEVHEPHGPKLVLVPVPVRAAIALAVCSLGLLPALYALVASP